MAHPSSQLAPDRMTPVPVLHRDEEYDTRGFDLLRDMQERHFWYRGRHRFLLHAVQRYLGSSPERAGSWRVLDLGGGCGGWLAYLLKAQPFAAAELALADSSEVALRLSRDCLPAAVGRYQADLLDLPWQERWDVVFLLDVLEHIPAETEALQQIYKALAPGGFLFLTTPALNCFWTWNDEVAGHQRRYAKRDLRRLAGECGFRLLEARYFMFFLSPILLASRLGKRPRLEELSADAAWELMKKTHKVPNAIVNALLGAIFAAETPLGHYLPFPWGTSILGVLQKPAAAASVSRDAARKAAA